MQRRSAVILSTLAALALAACDGGGATTDIERRRLGSPLLSTFESCEELATELKDNLREEMKISLLQYLDENNPYGFWGPSRGGVEDAAAPNAAAGDAESSSGQRQEGVDFSGTNNQEAGVDEGDFVKTDGYHIYALNGRRLEILGVPNFGEVEPVSTFELEGWPMELLVSGGQAVVFSQIWTYDLPYAHDLRAATVAEGDDSSSFRSPELVKISILDISDRGNPVLTRELFLEGYYHTSRKIDSSVRLVSSSWMNVWDVRFYPELPDNYWSYPQGSSAQREALRRAVFKTIEQNNRIIDEKPLADFLPSVYERLGSGEIITHSFATDSCTRFAIANDGATRGFTSILSIDTANPAAAFDADHVVSNPGTVYASTDTLIIAEPAQNWWWWYGQNEIRDQTNLHRFDISQAGQTVYTGSGRVDGAIQKQFQISEKDGVIRVSTTEDLWGRWWVENPPPVTNSVFTLEGEGALEVVGSVTGLAPGERIWSTRFVGDKAYVVTFRNIDPLWVIDLANPRAPAVLGELHIPGVSTYIHPLENDRLLTIGIAGDDQGLDWGTTQVQLFDVSNSAAPALVDEMTFGLPPASQGWSYAYSEAQYEHKAFTFWAPKGKLAIPMSTWRSQWSANYYWYEYKSELKVIDVNDPSEDAAPLALQGSVDHSAYFNDEANYWWGSPSIRRSIFMGDFVYAVSDKAVSAHRLSDLGRTDVAELRGNDGEVYWYY